MRAFLPSKIFSIIIILAVIAVGVFAFFCWSDKSAKPISEVTETVETVPRHTILGLSVQGRNIDAYSYGNGPTHLAFIGGIHGGYEWNSVLLAYHLMDYLKVNPDMVSKNLTVTVIPSANPDGVYKVTGRTGPFSVTDVSTSTEVAKSGRFNANAVDLNRNFACNWQATSTWQSRTVSAGANVFSEPEARAIRDFVLKDKPSAVIFWHSMSNAVYASQCNQGILPGTLELMNTYSLASGYPAVKEFNSYVVTGAAEDWLASINIPAITVELKTHEAVEWDKNLAGIKALFRYFSSSYPTIQP